MSTTLNNNNFLDPCDLMKKKAHYDKMKQSNNSNARPGCKDVWNAFMTEGANFGKYDIPYCPTTATNIPKRMLTWEEAKSIHKRHIMLLLIGFLMITSLMDRAEYGTTISSRLKFFVILPVL